MAEFKITIGSNFVATEPNEEDGNVLVTVGYTSSDNDSCSSVLMTPSEVGMFIQHLNAAMYQGREQMLAHGSLGAMCHVDQAKTFGRI